MRWVVALLLLFGVAMRLLPHEANVAPIAALALFGGVYLRPRYALVLPLGALILSDLVIGFDSWQSRFTVYGSFLLVGLIGLLVRRQKHVLTIVAGSLAGSAVFYLVTNLVFLYPDTMYAHSFAGQMQSYVNALPFFRNTLLGDLLYVGIIFGAFELAREIAAWRVRNRQLTTASVPPLRQNVS